MGYCFGSGMGFDREIRLARIRTFRWFMETATIGAILGVMSQGESAHSVLRIPFAGVALVCHILNLGVQWYERKLLS
jgi:hypothetical protein